MNMTHFDVKAPATTEATPIYYGILTDQGQALLAEAIASGTPLPLTQMAVGDGAGQPVTPLPEMTELVNEVHRAALNQLFVDPTASNEIVAEMVMDETTGGFWIRELGLYDETGTLFAIANAPDSYKPVLVEGAGRALLTRMVLVVSDSSAVELILNPDTVMASLAYVDAKIAEHAASRDHPAAAEGAQGMIPLATPAMVAEGIDHSSAVTPKTANETFARQQHEHEIDDVLWLQEALDGKLPAEFYNPRADAMNNEGGAVIQFVGDLNTLTMGTYVLAKGAGSTNYPDATAGYMYVETRSIYSADALLQVAWPYEADSAVWFRNYSSNTDSWLPWVKMYDTAHKPTAADVGALAKAGDTATGNLTAPKFIMNAPQGTGVGDAVRYDFTHSQMPRRYKELGSGVDLNTMTIPGIYVQSNSVDISGGGANYPATHEGALLVHKIGPAQVQQAYMTWNTDGARRRYYRNGDGATWSPWTTIYDTNFKPTADDVGAVNKSGDEMTGVLQLPAGHSLVLKEDIAKNWPSAAVSNEAGYAMLWRHSTDDGVLADEFLGINANHEVIFRKDKGLGDGSYSDLRIYHQDDKQPGTIGSSTELSANVDLDTMKTPGVWHQSASAEATIALHYPEASAGSLVIYAAAGVVQEYRVYNSSRVWVRAQYSDGAWTAWAKQYNTLNKPTVADLGAAPASHTHPAAQGNADIIAAGYAQVGTYLFLWWSNPTATNVDALAAGAELAYADGEGNHAGSPPGTWKQLGYRAVPANDNFGSMSTLFIRVV